MKTRLYKYVDKNGKIMYREYGYDLNSQKFLGYYIISDEKIAQ